MWYKIESKSIIIYLSDDLIAINPELSTDLCAEIVTSMQLSYWDLLKVFRSNDSGNIKKILKDFKQFKYANFIEQTDEDIVGYLVQKKGRKNKTTTYFTVENNTLLVSKRPESNLDRCNIIKEKVILGEYLLPKLSELINNKDIVSFESLFIASIEKVFDKFKVDNDNNILKPEAIDCIAKNTIITIHGFDFFDIEYSPSITLTKSHFLFRCALGFNKKYTLRRNWPYKAPYDLYMIFCNSLSIKPDIENDINSELKFRKPILDDKSKGLSKKELSRGFYNTTPFVLKLFRWLKYNIN